MCLRIFNIVYFFLFVAKQRERNTHKERETRIVFNALSGIRLNGCCRHSLHSFAGYGDFVTRPQLTPYSNPVLDYSGCRKAVSIPTPRRVQLRFALAEIRYPSRRADNQAFFGRKMQPPSRRAENQAFFGRKMQQQVFFLSYPKFFLFSFSKKKELWCGVRGSISPDIEFRFLHLFM